MGISVTQLVIIMVIVILLFGTKRVRTIGADVGEAIKNFRSSMKEGEGDKSLTASASENRDGKVELHEESNV
ncbi:twin-arginine translocase TatA/TatE family subunit [Methylicorpusculum sp.]|uniref:twin-arginine translocase TatA/TatE family subunit n=1 Tax=Methylicorpusculum sp. TaxID=2713644 RepID=UPI00272FFC19|nr:twin-arginine translocase TatA/TatE family subunit [Methylicorpusculum sp.]MDP2177159.1 twin-arginine translocase TatA/TatE family subunit [Methylicorpusculum sp.]MDP3531302.1 twin-arginine translocase TatA/TatE family subunit [Methylicorpusculum sp.]MDZ4150457.1 twin-arginine translocase TatA/TatE family subunit [Methylicorpusculum sp.]